LLKYQKHCSLRLRFQQNYFQIRNSVNKILDPSAKSFFPCRKY